MHKKFFSLLVAPTLVLPVAAMGGSLLRDQISICETANCAAATISGNLRIDEPFVLQVYAGEDECLRLAVTSQTTDLEMVAVSTDPEERAYSDDDSGGTFLPLIQVDPVPATGYFTVVLSTYDGVVPNGNFVLRYGRYPTGNTNCLNPTAPMSPSANTLNAAAPNSLSTKQER